MKTWQPEGRKGTKVQESVMLLELILEKKKPLADLQQGALYNSVMDHMLLSALARPGMKSLSRLNI
ncbi:hypothetical protein [Nitrosospira multiformis]|uniref:hypothetical protein n=1 Tax=Nitrosospira multiformis TaxID=1231 RepID=UPI00111425B5|nr:hypothetical protein [Nitrosospira multiformis]